MDGDPIKRPATDEDRRRIDAIGLARLLTDHECTVLLAGLAHVSAYAYVDITDLRERLLAARAQPRQERSR